MRSFLRKSGFVLFPVVLFLLAPLTDLGAQVTPSIKTGDQVRVKAPSIRGARIGTPWIRGSFVSLDATSLRLKEKARMPLKIPLASVTKLEVSRVHRSRAVNVWKGVLIGAGIGVVVGTLSAASFDEEETNSDLGCFLSACSRGQAFWYPMALVGGPLAVLFAGIGAALPPGEHWEEVPLRPRVSLSPRGEVQVALRYEFGK